MLIGLFGVTAVLLSAEEGIGSIYSGSLGKLLPNRQELRRGLAAGMRGTVWGFLVGIIPGLLASVAAFISYDMEKRVSKEPEKFGTGMIEGVAAPEAANNAAAVAGFVPLMALGIPTTPTMAILLAALLVYGVKPGPLLFTEQATFTWTVIASMYLGNVMLLILNLPLVGLWAKLASVPYRVMAPLILIFSLVGSYSLRNSLFDVWVTLIFGLLGYLMKKRDWPAVPLILGFIMGPLLEQSLRQSLALSRSELTIFFDRPIARVLIFATLALGPAQALWRRLRKRNQPAESAT